MKSGKAENAKISKRNKLLVNILLISIAVVFCLLAVLIYINYYTRVRLVLTTVSRYKTGEIKSVTEYDIIDVKKGRNLDSLPTPSMEGYTFDGWFKDINYTQPFDYNEHLNAHMQVYGKFDLLEYNIELVLEGDKKVKYNVTTDIDYTQNYTIEDIIKFPKIADVIVLEDDSETTLNQYKTNYKQGFVFAGWGLSSSAQNTYTDTFPMRAQNLTFYAVWQPIKVELRYYSQDLNFTGSSITQIVPRIDTLTGGLNYNGKYEKYTTINTQYNNSVEVIIPPTDDYENFDFGGWYLDPEFLVPLKTTQLYVKNGYFTMSKESNINVLYDSSYYNYASVSDAHKETIKSYSSTNEEDSYISLFAKWIPRQYSVKFNLNIPASEFLNYVDTSNMGAVLTRGYGLQIWEDDGSYIRQTKASQGVKMLADDYENGVLHDKNYFKDIVYRKDDETGLPLYTILSWNTKKDGSGYTVDYNGQTYFDKDNFTIENGTITLYAQWKSYYRVNFFFRVSAGGYKNIRLATYNIEKDVFTLPEFKDLVVNVGQNGAVDFNKEQIEKNNITRSYSIPLNQTFVGWTDGYNVISGLTPVYIPGFGYDIGNKVESNEGIYLNSAEKNLYAYFIDNDNYFTYDMNLNKNDVVTYAGNIKEKFFDENDDSIVYHYTTTQSYYVQNTANAERYQITKTDGSADYILWGWTLLDGTEIDGSETRNLIKFNSENLKYVYNLADYEEVKRDFKTNISFDGRVELDTPNYYTIYDSIENKSSLYAKVVSKILVFKAKWIENVEITFNDGADDVVWEDGHSVVELAMLGAGNLKITMPDLPKTLAYRANYEFVGWSKINRESEGISYGEFINSSNTIYYAKKQYTSFSDDTVLYAVWKPIVYSVNINQLSYDSTTNYNAGTIYIAKEKYDDSNKHITDEININGSVISYTLFDGTEKSIVLNTSAMVGKGLAGWTDKKGNELEKSSIGYVISVKDDKNDLFAINPTQSGDYLIGLYPKYEELQFTVTFKLSGEGLETGYYNQVLDEVSYGTSVRTLLNSIELPLYEQGYEYSGWIVEGDVESSGSIKDEYLLDLKTTNLTVRSDMILTLKAKKQQFNITVTFRNPSSGTIESIKSYVLEFNEVIDSIVPEILAELEMRDYRGWNFAWWDISGGGSSNSFTNLDGRVVTSPLSISPYYTPAKLDINFNYYSEYSSKPDKMETFTYSSSVGSVYSLNSSLFGVEPYKNDSLFNGFSYDGGTTLFVDGDKIYLTVAKIGDYMQEVTDVEEKEYTLDLYAYWSEAVRLTIDLSEYSLNGVVIPGETVVKKGETIYFADLGNISRLTSNQIFKDDLSVFTGRWVDQNGQEYNAYLSSASIVMNEHITLKPVFETASYSVEYYYRLNGDYYPLSGATQTIELDYVTPLSLHDYDTLTNYIWQNYLLVDYSCVALYLGETAFENKDGSLKLDFGSQFDFKNNSIYMSYVEGFNFKVYMDLRKLSSITYYSDRDSNSSTTVVGVLEGADYVIGASDLSKTKADIIPEKEGYDFVGWSTSLMSNSVSYYNNSTVTYSVNSFAKLYPVWQLKKVIISYYETDGTLILKDSADAYSTISLLGDTVVENYKLVGWQVNGTGYVYKIDEPFTLSTSDVDLYVVREKHYTIYYHNNLGNQVTFNEHIIIGETFVPIAFTDTGLKGKSGAEFVDWSFEPDVNAFVAGSFTLNERSGSTLVSDKWTITLSGANDYTIHLYAIWNSLTFSATFTTYASDGTTSMLYGVAGNPTSYSTTEIGYEYDTTNYLFEFPFTAETYTLNGVTYKYSGEWQDENGDKYTISANVNFVENKTFTPCYKEVFGVLFKVDGTELYSDYNILNGTVYNLTNNELVSLINNYNNLLSGSKLVGWQVDGKYYSHLASGDSGFNLHNWQKTITITKFVELEAVVEDLYTINIFTQINVVGEDYVFDKNSKQVAYGVEGDTIDLSQYAYSSNGYSVSSWVFSNDENYIYNPSGTAFSSYTITNDGSGYVIYAYPLVYVQVGYAVDSVDNVKATKNVILGGVAERVTGLIEEDDHYLGDWQYENGDVYNDEPINAPITLVAQALPYYTLQMADPDRRIDDSLVFTKLTPSKSISIPSDDDVTYDKVTNGGGLKLTGWYIMNVSSSQYVMNGSTRRIFAFRETITVNDLIEAGIGGSYTFGLVPIFEFTLVKVSFVNVYSAVEYSISAYDGKTYHTTENGMHSFYVLKNSDMVASNSEVRFQAYKTDSYGNVIFEDYEEVKSVITVSATIKSGYAYSLTSGFFYCIQNGSDFEKSNMINQNSKVNSDIFITANEPTAESINISVGLANSAYSTLNDLNVAYFEVGGAQQYDYYATTKANAVSTIKLVVADGYELAKNSDGQFVALNDRLVEVTGTLNVVVSENSGYYTINYRANSSGRIYFVIKESSQVRLKLNVSDSEISQFDDAKLNDLQVRVYAEESFAWKLKAELAYADIVSGYELPEKIETGTKIKIETVIDSAYYYVKTIVLSGTSLGEQTVLGSVLENYKVSLAPVVAINLAERKYQVDYYLDDDFKEKSDEMLVTENLSFALKEFELGQGKVKGGYVVLAQNNSGIWTVVAVTNGSTYSNSAENILLNSTLSSQAITIRVKEVSYYSSVSVKLSAETGKAVIDGSTPTTSKTILVPLTSVVTINGNKITTNVGSYVLGADGTLSGVTEQTFTILPKGSYEFDGWYVDGEKITGLTIDSAIEIVGKVVEGTSTLTITTTDLISTDNCRLQDLIVASYGVTTSETHSFNVFYDGSINSDGKAFGFATGKDVTIEYSVGEHFTLKEIRFTYLNKSSHDYSSVSDFASECGIEIILDDDKITVKGAIDNISVGFRVERNSYLVKAQLVQTSQSTTELDALYSSYLSSGKVFVKLNNTSLSITGVNISTLPYGSALNISLAVNNQYFKLSKIYINSTSTMVYPTSNTDVASFDATNSILTIFAGILTDETIMIEVEFKDFNAVFHKPDGKEMSIGEMSANGINPSTTFAYNSTSVFNLSDFDTPLTNVVSGGITYKFIKWQVYNGNWEQDNENNVVDMSKLSDISNYSHIFNGENGNIHLFGVWEKLYNLYFDANGSNVGNMPSNLTELALTDVVSLEKIPTREGYDFVGWKYVFNGSTYTLYLNGSGEFNKLTDASGNYVGYNTADILNKQASFGQIITAEQCNSSSALAGSITLQAVWSEKEFTLTITYDNSKCSITQQVYSGGTYSDGAIQIRFNDTLTMESISTTSGEQSVVLVKNGSGQIKGRIIVTTITNYELKCLEFNGVSVSEGSTVTVSGNSVLNVVCWGVFVEHNLTLKLDKRFDGELLAQDLTLNAYSLSDNTLANNAYEYVGISSNSDNYNVTHIFKVRVGFSLHVLPNVGDYEIDVTAYDYVSDSAVEGKPYLIKLDTSSTDELDYVVKFVLSSQTISIGGRFEDNAESECGEYEVMYYVPVRTDGIITDYTLQSETISNALIGSFSKTLVNFTNVVVNYSSNDFRLVSVNGANANRVNGSYSIAIDSDSDNYVLNFDYKYVKVDFTIAGNTYASAYFKTQAVDDESDAKLQAFYQLITYGYSYVAGNDNLRDKLFGSASAINDASNIIKSFDPVSYYTIGELAELFVYDVNNNLAKTLFGQNDYKNVWFEEWLTKLTFGENMTINGNNDIIVINAGTSEAIVFDIDVTIDENARGGVNYQDSASVNYSYAVVKNIKSCVLDGYNYYSKITLKIKSGTYLPQLIVGADSNSYFSGASYIEACSGKLLYTSGVGGIMVSDNRYDITAEVKIKKILINVSTNANSTFNSQVEVTYSTTFDEFLALAGLNINIGLEKDSEKYWAIKGIFVDEDQIDLNYNNFDYYFNNVIGAEYANGAVIDVLVKYDEFEKVLLNISGIFTKNNSSEIQQIATWYAISGSEIAGKYSGDFDSYVAGSYKTRTQINKTTFSAYTSASFNEKEDIPSLSGDSLVIYLKASGENGLYNYSYDNKSWTRAYLTTNSADVGWSDSGVYWQYFDIEMGTDVVSDAEVSYRKKRSSIYNEDIIVTADTNMYFVYISEITRKYSFGNYTELDTPIRETKVFEGTMARISDMASDYRNWLISKGYTELSNLQLDYVVINGVSYYSTNGSDYNSVFMASDTDELIIEFYWKSIED